MLKIADYWKAGRQGRRRIGNRMPHRNAHVEDDRPESRDADQDDYIALMLPGVPWQIGKSSILQLKAFHDKTLLAVLSRLLANIYFWSKLQPGLEHARDG